MMGVRRIVVPVRGTAALEASLPGAGFRDDLTEGAEEPLDDVDEELEEEEDPLEESSELLADESESELLSDSLLDGARPAGLTRVTAAGVAGALGKLMFTPTLDVASAGVTTGGATEALAECFAFLDGRRPAGPAPAAETGSTVELDATKAAGVGTGTGGERFRFFSSPQTAGSTAGVATAPAAGGCSRASAPACSLTLLDPQRRRRGQQVRLTE